MATTPSPPATVEDLLKRLGNIPPWRVRLHPAPGTATEEDLLRVVEREKRPCELVDGTLVERATGFPESLVCVALMTAVSQAVRPRRLGMITGSTGPMRLRPGLVRAPSIAFTSWGRIPGRKRPKEPIPHLAPDLAVEVLSRGNTPAEIGRKLGEYFGAGVRLVWVVDPRKRTIRVYRSADRSILLKEGRSLDGGDVLPGFTLSLQDLFAGDEP